MKSKLKKIIAAVGIMTLTSSNIFAATQMIYKFDKTQIKYEILLDGESLQIPDEVTFDDGKSIKLNEFKKSLAEKVSDVIKYSNGTFTYNGGLSRTGIYGEYIPFFTNIGLLKDDINQEEVIKRFEKYALLENRKENIENCKKSIAESTDEEHLKKSNLRLANYMEDVERIEKIDINTKTDNLIVMSSLPYISRVSTLSEEINLTSNILKETRDMKYYIYDLIYRDLRLINLKYSVNSNTYEYVPGFDKDKYTYTIKLPENTLDNASIITNSTNYMDAILKNNNVNGYNLGIEVEDDAIELVNGYGVAKVNVVFNILDTFGKYIDGYTSNPKREYKVIFTKYDFIKGDLDKNGIVNANDAAIALDLYKYGNVSKEELKIGDMDNNGIINANDAALILDIYKYGN